MMNTFTDLFKSKKFLANAAAVALLLFYGDPAIVPTETTQNLIYLVMTYVLGQGIADHGKEAVKAGKAPVVPVK